MSPTMGTMLTNDVVPRLKAAARSVPKTGADDNEEIIEDLVEEGEGPLTVEEPVRVAFVGVLLGFPFLRAKR